MKSKLTPLFAKFSADDIKDHFSIDSNAYIGIGRSLSFGSSAANVEEIAFTTNKINELYRNMVAVKRIVAADMQIVVARRDWAANIVYDAYEDDVDLYTFEDFVDLGTANANVDTVLSGTVSFNSFGQPLVTGLGTEFTKYFFVGDQIKANSEIRTVLQINNDTSLLVNNNFLNAATGVAPTLVGNGTIIVANSSNFIGNVFTGNVVIVQNTAREVVAVRSNKVISVNANLNISVSNTTLIRKDNTYPLYANNFYVRNDRDQVFKCLFNNNRANSIVQPTVDIDGQLPENPSILTADGYKWKYLYTIAPGLKQKFFTTAWMPVANDNAVVAATAEGRIDIINVLWGGSGHIGGSNSNTARILSITNTDGANANLSCRVSNGVITGVTILNGGNNYTIGTVTVNDPDKLGLTTLGGTVNAFGTTITANTSNAQMNVFTGNVFTNDVVTINNESRNVVTVTSATEITVNSAFTYMTNTQIMTIQRSNASFDIEFSPPSGHGFFPGRELGARSLMITVELDGDENSTLPVSDAINIFDFNQISIIDDPLIANGAFYANNTNYRVSTRVLVSDPGISNFLNDETVFIGSSLGNATMVANVAHWSASDNYLYINNITGPFSPSDLIRGQNSGTIATVLEIANSQIKLYSGELLYIENRQNIVRDEDQIEQLKIVLTF
jgi:hypothetical protein